MLRIMHHRMLSVMHIVTLMDEFVMYVVIYVVMHVVMFVAHLL